MTETTFGISMIFGLAAIGLIGALVGAWMDREANHIVIILHWMGGLATISHVITMLGP